MPALLLTLLLLIAALVIVTRGDSKAIPGKPGAKVGTVAIGKPAAFDSRCGDAYRAVRYYRAKYDQHRTVLGFSLAPPLEQAMECPRLRERARYWIHAAKVNREAAAPILATIRRLDRGLEGTPMGGLGTILEQEGRRAGISPYFMAAAAGTESSFGAAPCSSNRMNVWGLASCGNGWHVPYFNTWREAIRFYARFLAARWPAATSPYDFHGYAACDACWGRKTTQHMGRFGAGTSTRYGA